MLLYPFTTQTDWKINEHNLTNYWGRLPYPHPPPAPIGLMKGFSLKVSPSSIKINKPRKNDTVKTAVVSVESILGYDKTVTLSTGKVPEGVSVSFSPFSDTPTFGSTMSIRVDSTAKTGTIKIAIHGSADDGKICTCNLNLTIN